MERGFSLIEVIIGSCVILFLLAPALAVVSQGTKTLNKARMTVLASSIMQSQMEDFRAMNFDTLQANYVTGKTQPITLNTNTSAEGFTNVQSGQITVTGNFAAVSGFTNLIELTLTASWTDTNGQTQLRRYYSRFSKNGLSDKVVNGF